MGIQQVSQLSVLLRTEDPDVWWPLVSEPDLCLAGQAEAVGSGL